MPGHHTTTIEINYGVDTQGYFSFEQPDALLVFVHGFGGNAITTWDNFSTFALDDQHFKKTDIVFYGYDTLQGQVGDHASEFYQFLNKLVMPKQNKILPTNQKLPERDYKKIVCVAHSLGALIVRQAMLYAHDDKTSWADKCSLALFAPAHQGATVASLASTALTGMWSLLAVVAKYQYPILNELDPNVPGIIQAIKDRTESLQNANVAAFTKAKLVVYAKGDKIVRNIPYPGDKAAIVVKGHNHMSVCKPKNTYTLPIDELKNLI